VPVLGVNHRHAAQQQDGEGHKSYEVFHLELIISEPDGSVCYSEFSFVGCFYGLPSG
jgi:hypothetical protein